MILTIRTDKPEAEIGLFDAQGTKIAYEAWLAHRELADTLLSKIKALLESQQKTFTDVTGIVAFQGPGSFTGLRIGITVANTFAYSQDIPIVGAMGEQWIQDGIKTLTTTENKQIVLPEYGAEANISKPRK